MADEMLTPGDGQIRAFVTVAGNPVLSSPNGRRLEQALEGLEFMVSVDYYLNETSRHADLILPPTTALERSHYDLIFSLFAIRNVAKFSDPLFPPAPDQRHDWQILLELAHRLETRRAGGRLPLRSELGWRAFKRLGPDPLLDLLLRTGPYGTAPGRLRPLVQPAVDLILDLLPERHPLHGLAMLSPVNRRWQALPKGLSLTALRDHPHGVDLGSLQATLPERLFTRGRPHSSGTPPLPPGCGATVFTAGDTPDGRPAGDRPPPRAQQQLLAAQQPTPGERQGPVHPDDPSPGRRPARSPDRRPSPGQFR